MVKISGIAIKKEIVLCVTADNEKRDQMRNEREENARGYIEKVLLRCRMVMNL